MFVTARTILNHPFHQVLEFFNSELFLKLKPPFSKINLRSLEMNRFGGKVDLTVETPFSKIDWKGKIITRYQDDDVFSFTDIGDVIPSPLQLWVHHHAIYKKGEKTVLEDRIHFDTSSRLKNIFVKLIIKLVLFMRKFGYKSYYRSIL